MPNNTTRNRAQYGTRDTVFILYRLAVGDRYVPALLTRCFYRLFNRCCRDNLRLLWATLENVQTGHRCNTQRGSHANPYTRQH